MIATAAFGNVMKQRGKVEQLNFWESRRELRGEWKTLRIDLAVKASDVAYQLQRVRINSINMKQIMLHETHDPAEFRDVATQDSEQAHPSQLLRKLFRITQ